MISILLAMLAGVGLYTASSLGLFRVLGSSESEAEEPAINFELVGYDKIALDAENAAGLVISYGVAGPGEASPIHGPCAHVVYGSIASASERMVFEVTDDNRGKYLCVKLYGAGTKSRAYYGHYYLRTYRPSTEKEAYWTVRNERFRAGDPHDRISISSAHAFEHNLGLEVAEYQDIGGNHFKVKLVNIPPSSDLDILRAVDYLGVANQDDCNRDLFSFDNDWLASGYAPKDYHDTPDGDLDIYLPTFANADGDYLCIRVTTWGSDLPTRRSLGGGGLPIIGRSDYEEFYENSSHKIFVTRNPVEVPSPSRSLYKKAETVSVDYARGIDKSYFYSRFLLYVTEPKALNDSSGRYVVNISFNLPGQRVFKHRTSTPDWIDGGLFVDKVEYAVIDSEKTCGSQASKFKRSSRSGRLMQLTLKPEVGSNKLCVKAILKGARRGAPDLNPHKIFSYEINFPDS